MEKQRKKQGNTETANETAQVEVSNLMDLFDSSDSDKMQNTETTFEPVKSDSSDNHPSTLSSTEDEMPLGSQAFSLSVPKRPLPARDCHSSKQVKVSNLMDLFDNSGCDKGQNSETEESDFTGSNADYNPSSTPSSTEDEALSKHQSKKKNVRRALDKAPSSTEDEMPLGSQASSLSVPKRPLPARDLHSSKQVEVSNLMDSFDHSDPPSTQSSTEDEVLECPSEKLKKRSKRPQITVKTSKTKNGRRAWDKAHYCVYCEKANMKIARHLERKHSEETDVAHAFSFPARSKQRRILLESLRNKGNWQHNVKVLQDGQGEIVTWKQPHKGASPKDFLPCQNCFAMFKRTELWRHRKTCRNRKEETVQGKRRVQKASSQLIPIKDSSQEIQNIIHSMMQDHVTSHIRTDKMICTYGNALFAKKGREQSQHRYIAQKMRELGRFVLAAKEIDKCVSGLKDLCDPTKFHLAIKAARSVSDYNTEKSEYGKPSTAVKIGFSLKGATETWIGHCLMSGDVLTEKKAKKFKELLDTSWSSYVSANAHSTMEQRRWNKEDCIPLTEDIVCLQNHLRKLEDEAKAELGRHVTTTAYKTLSECLLAQIIVFNKKREGEASRLTLETYLNADTGAVNKDIFETLSPVEKQLSRKLTRIVTRGKRGRKVPILLLDCTKSSIDFMIKMRSKVGILHENPFLFARIGTMTNIRGCDCLRKYAQECKASNPELLRSTKLRKHVATLCQLLHLDNQELEQVARFMGHDIRVHCDYYRQTDKTFQVAKIGKLLFAMEQGGQALTGKSLMTLDSVVFDGTSTNAPKRHGDQESGGDDDDDVDVDDDLPCTSTTNPPAHSHKRVRTNYRRDAGDDPDIVDKNGNDMTKPKRVKKPADDDDDDDDGCDVYVDVEECDEDGDGEEQHITSTISAVKQRQKHHDDDDAPQVSRKRPWTAEERTVVLRRMGKFVALRKVPGKNDCQMCICKESPVLNKRTWKDVKYYVHNEIAKVKKKLAF
uniref:uncharacterized protein LOC122759139 isoform X1 n=1 Tax=Solea senegalensis TaxID=28829 RepID=UPI001CD86042|nr:uncharacterized protein LOC122759139 isoform X1 [Solea senegalensis]XP_043891037.1 uncharacterized protein LOC122775268 isoform X2 [Solea senegalensis]